MPIIDPDLLEEMRNRNDNEKVKINILMQEQSDSHALRLEASRLDTKQERRDFVIGALKRQASTTQSDVLTLLRTMEQDGIVEEIRPLWIVNSISCMANKAAIARLAQRSEIMTVYHCKESRWLFDDEYISCIEGENREIADNLLQVNAQQVWELGYTGEGVLIGIIDTGVSLTHADLQGRFWDGGAEYPNHGYDFYSHDNDPSDERGHGTHVAGTICGTGASGTQTGIAPGAKIMSLKVFDANELTDEAVWIEAMQFAVEHGAHVLNMSLGQPLPDASVKFMMRQACDNTLAAGVVAAVCAGNVRQMQSMIPIPYNIYSPGDCPPPHIHDDQMVNSGGTSCVICVGAVDSNNNIAGFSSVGPSVWTDVAQYNDYPYTPGDATEIGLIRPDISAPGVHIKSLDYSNNNGYTLKDGTSMATPLVAGTIALMLSKDGELTPEQIDEILERTATPLTEHKSNDFGAGLLNAYAAVMAVGEDGMYELETVNANVYPNPSNDSFTVTCHGMRQINVFASDGKLTKSIPTEDETEIISGLEDGVYIIQITTEDSITNHKVIKINTL